MPWRETCAVEERNAFVHDVLCGVASKAELCRRYGISRPTGDRWLARFEALGVAGLEDRSSVPGRHPNEVPAELVALIMGLRQEHRTWGPRKLRAWLQGHNGRVRWPAASTIGEILRRRGLTSGRRRRHRTPPYTQPFAGYDAPNAVWCADFKGWFRMGNAQRCYPLTISDGFSRYLLRCDAMANEQGEGVRQRFEKVFHRYGLPWAIRTDNGPPFASRGLAGLSRLSIWWLKLGIVPERIAAGRPEQNGRHERMHRTLKEEATVPAASSLSGQQRCFDRFRAEYNEERPHEALGQCVPAERYERSARSYPRRLPEPEYPAEMAVRSVQAVGTIKWRRQYVYVGQALAGEPVGLASLSEDQHLVYFCSLAIGVLDERRRKVWDLERAACLGLVDRSLLRRPFRYASGPPQEPDM